MPLLGKLSPAFPATLLYITLGALIEIWSIAWLIFFPPQTDNDAFWGMGFILTGLALIVIGLLLGRIGRAAKNAELPPPEAVKAVTEIDKEVARNPPPLPPPPPPPPPPAEKKAPEKKTEQAPAPAKK